MLMFIYFNEPANESIENMDPNVDAKSNEAIQGIFSVYNKDAMIVNSMTATNSLNSPLLQNTGNLGLTGSTVTLTGDICTGGNNKVCIKANDLVKTLSKLNKNDYMYKSSECVIYNDILLALASSQSEMTVNKPIAKYGNPVNFGTKNIAMWNRRPILYMGSPTDGLNGIIVNVPANMSVIWIRCLNDRATGFKVYDTSGKSYGVYVWGRRSLNTISPDGGGFDTYASIHTWMPIALPIGTTQAGALNTARNYVITNPTNANNTDVNNSFLSGIAFSTNPWNHASISAMGLWWTCNGGDKPPGWVGDSALGWNNDLVVNVGGGLTKTFIVPSVYSGKDKLLYIVTNNNIWNDNMGVIVKVNGVQIEKFRATYDNPFARHHSSKIYSRYIATLIPASLIQESNPLLSVSLDSSASGVDNGMNYLGIREIGTHDAY